MEAINTLDSRSRDSARIRSALIVCGVALASAALYLATPTRDYFWDGITFALQIRKAGTGRLDLLFHQNHLLYNLFGFGLSGLGRILGLDVRTLSLLQIANSLIAAAGISTFYTTVKRVTGDRYAAGVAAGFLGVGATWWKLSTDADAYIAAVVLLIVCVNSLLREGPRYWTASLAFGLAMLTHELASLFSVALLTILILSRSDKRRRDGLLLTLTAGWALALAVYAVCGFALYRISDPVALLRWVTSNPSALPLQWNPLPGIWPSARANLDLIAGHGVSVFLKHPGPLGWSLAGLAALACIVAAIPAFERLRMISRSGVLSSLRTRPSVPAMLILSWIVPYLAFLLFFEPQDPYLRLFYAPAIAMGLGLVVAIARRHRTEGTYPRILAGAAASAVSALALFNLAFFIAPHMRAESNPLVVAAKAARVRWDSKTVIYYAARNEADTTFEYFNEQTDWRRISRESLPTIDSEIADVLQRGGSVWLNSGAAGLRGDELLQNYEILEDVRVDVPFAPARYIKIVPRSF
ncbi:MAG TPA: hypothetical protein VFV34_06730 [Blastocatellia bacterium]|nr:hypothetical protein [Blastocatellia bacterium]